MPRKCVDTIGSPQRRTVVVGRRNDGSRKAAATCHIMQISTSEDCGLISYIRWFFEKRKKGDAAKCNLFLWTRRACRYVIGFKYIRIRRLTKTDDQCTPARCRFVVRSRYIHRVFSMRYFFFFFQPRTAYVCI